MSDDSLLRDISTTDGSVRHARRSARPMSPKGTDWWARRGSTRSRRQDSALCASLWGGFVTPSEGRRANHLEPYVGIRDNDEPENVLVEPYAALAVLL